jgi:hypothetical protein
MTAVKETELERINRIARRETGPDITTRREWASTWSARLAAMLEKPAGDKVPGRIWRLRYFQDDDFLVCTLVQNIRPVGVAPGQQVPKVMVFLTRPYHRANAAGGSTSTLSLFGEYSTDEIVAFLRLDILDPEDAGAEWRDETRYSDFIIVRDVLKQHGARLN